MSFKKLVLISDMDQTFLTTDARPIPENLQAVRRFVEAGGDFTVATGRPTRGVPVFPEITELITLPVISYNGARISDIHSGEILLQHTLPDNMEEVVRQVRRRFPDLGCMIFHGKDDETFTVKGDALTHEVLELREHYTQRPHTLKGISLPWNKVVFTGYDVALNKEALDFICRIAPDVCPVLTEDVFLEISVAGATKGTALRELSGLTGIPLESFMAIGDSVNDLAMLEAAGVGAAVANCSEEVRRRISRIYPSCNEAGVAAFIRREALPRLEELQKEP